MSHKKSLRACSHVDNHEARERERKLEDVTNVHRRTKACRYTTVPRRIKTVLHSVWFSKHTACLGVHYIA